MTSWWGLCKFSTMCVLGLMTAALIVGLIVGVPAWLLYKLFFVVLP